MARSLAALAVALVATAAFAGPGKKEADRAIRDLRTATDAKVKEAALKEIGKIGQVQKALVESAVDDVVKSLKDKVPAFANIDPAVVHLAGALDENRAPKPMADAGSALVNLGYGHPQAAAAIAAAARNAGDGADTATLIRQGLKELSK